MFAELVAGNRNDLQRIAKNPNARRLEVEDAMIVILKKMTLFSRRSS